MRESKKGRGGEIEDGKNRGNEDGMREKERGGRWYGAGK
jgi:hypothetical protein